ncbi:hypothetical protein BDR06DRAFT_966359 [Suillus hirtellus]|nr:hypothetical protein BDR06DRAFT_966359 [Suillus hirtellus]
MTFQIIVLLCFFHRFCFIDVIVLTLVLSLAKIAHMDFARLDSLLDHIALKCRVTAETVLAEWLERQEVADPESWKQLNGIPCITDRLTALLAHHGYTLHHYPENVLMPGERCPTLTKSKGIHDLTLHEQDLLANALKMNSITVQQINRKGLPCVKMAETSPEPSSEASVVLSLPAPSRQLHQRILWVSSPEDSPVPSPIPSHHHSPAMSPAPLHRPKVQVFIELPHAPPSWRLKATQQCFSPVSRPETSMLIPQIKYLSQLSATTDGIFHEEEETDEVLT